MKAVHTYVLPEEEHDFKCAAIAVDVQVALWKYSSHLRNKAKWPKNAAEAKVAAEFRKEFYEYFENLLVEE